jgi:hypothetical protein
VTPRVAVNADSLATWALPALEGATRAVVAAARGALRAG